MIIAIMPSAFTATERDTLKQLADDEEEWENSSQYDNDDEEQSGEEDMVQEDQAEVNGYIGDYDLEDPFEATQAANTRPPTPASSMAGLNLHDNFVQHFGKPSTDGVFQSVQEIMETPVPFVRHNEVLKDNKLLRKAAHIAAEKYDRLVVDTEHYKSALACATHRITFLRQELETKQNRVHALQERHKRTIERFENQNKLGELDFETADKADLYLKIDKLEDLVYDLRCVVNPEYC
jgi:hypothetical protein